MRTWLGIAVALLVGVWLGALLVDRGRDGVDRSGALREVVHASPRPAPREASLEELERLDDLLLEVRALRLELAEHLDRDALDRALPESAESSRVALDEHGDPRADVLERLPSELVRWMRRIDERMTNLAKSPGSLPVIRMPPEGLRPRPLPVPQAEDVDQEAFATSHLLWNYQDLLDTYGRPDIVHDATEWEYKYRDELGAENELGDVHFQFSGGLVVHAYAH